ncbi:MAG TPA: DUF4982 domain-containing protein [Acidobacteriaceae bacterium]|nr:DUF4982 domain-containing protein [Acidobacteriaceae bacterium]
MSRISRRKFVQNSSLAALALPQVLRGTSLLGAPRLDSETWEAAPASAIGPYTPPASPRATYNFNLDWRFIREDVPGAESPAFDDAKWSTVSTPHSFNDVDSYRELISHSGGDKGTYKGLSWYRKHFVLPADLTGRRIFLEFEGMRQAGDIYLNGKQVGLYENGINPYGIDITAALAPPGEPNVLAVKVDNTTTYKERAFCAANPKNPDGSDCVPTAFEWNANDFNPDHGGINRNVWLHAVGKIHQTLPLYYGLESQGIYVHAANFNVAKKTADITVDSEVHNLSGDRATVGLTAIIVDHAGRAAAQFDGDPVDMVDGEKSVQTATGPLTNAHFWSPDDPYLYTVVTILKVDGKVVDVAHTTTGFRKTAFKGGVGTGGIYINDQFTYLKGFADRTEGEWAAVGAGTPDWMHDYTLRMVRACHGNYMRWMHVSPQKTDSDSCDRFGIVQVCPAGDKERDVTGRQWDQRAEVMRNSIIYFRNSPSILFWEAGNTVVTADQMQQMVALRKQWDPEGGRVMGYRDNDNIPMNQALTPIAEYYGVMIAQAPQADNLKNPTDLFRGYSAERRDRAPIVEAEDFRDEGARRFWDDYSPPYYGFKKGPNDTYQYTSESFALAGVKRYWDYWSHRISNTDPAHSRWSGYCSIYFWDEDADGRQDSSEVARVSGKVDAVRLPKEIYFAHRVIQNPSPDLHILGHWTYPTDPTGGPDAGQHKTVKTVYVIANTESVELLLNGKSLGVNSKADSGYIFSFPDVEFAPGSLKAIGRNASKQVAQQELTTAGAPAAIKLTPILGPNGLQADASDVALIDVEVVDAKGERCPTDDARIDFTCAGAGIWRGGYNSGKVDSTNNLYLNTECGINRVFVRSTPTAGSITVTAKRDGLKPATLTLTSKPVTVTHGLATFMPARLPLTPSS